MPIGRSIEIHPHCTVVPTRGYRLSADAMVNLMLNNNSVSLPAPLPPAFFVGGNKSSGMVTNSDSWQDFEPDGSSSSQVDMSHNEVTMSEFDPR